MKLVIDISKDRYDEIMAMDWVNCRRIFDEEIRAIHDGKALEQEPCDDAISRAKTIDEVSRIIFDHPLDGYEDGQLILKTIQDMPSVTPAEKVWDWIPANQPPKASGRYIVTRHFFNDDFVEMASYSVDLHKVDKYDFPKRKAGWYNYDSEYGYYELDAIVAWMPLPERYKASPTGEEVEE